MPGRSDSDDTPPPRGSATVRDVARLACVSTATVSRVVNNSGCVSPDLEDRVRQAIASLGFRPNRHARFLRARSSHIVGIVLPSLNNPFFADAVCGIDEVLTVADYTLVLVQHRDVAGREDQLLRALHAEGTAGFVLVAGQPSSPAYRELLRAKVPMVSMNREVDEPVDAIHPADHEGAAMATRHLIQLGHRRIGLVNGLRPASSAVRREAGFRAAHCDAGLKCDGDLIWHGEWSEQGGYEGAAKLLGLAEPPTAILCSNSLLGLGALRAIRERGLAIPEDIAVVMFDDVSWTAVTKPSITVVRQPAREMGRTAARFLIERIASPEAAQQRRIFPMELIVRESG